MNNIFWLALYIIDIAMFLHAALTVLYLIYFATIANFTKRSPIPRAKKQNRFIVIIPAYHADDTVISTVQSILGQVYPQRMFDIVVISSRMSELTNLKLAQLPITLLTPPNLKSKAEAYRYAIDNMPVFKIYDAVLLLEHDSIIDSDFLEKVNNAYESAGTKAIQTHIVSKNRDTHAARLEAIFEEINNNIFRLGHIAGGFSSSLSNSGCVFDYEWFRENIKTVKSFSGGKELEMRLLRQNIYVDYFNDILVYDGKSKSARALNRQHGKEVTSQFDYMLRSLRYLPGAIFNRQYDMLNKIFQWWLIPRTNLVSLIAVMSIVMAIIYMSLAIKWWILGALILFVFAVATPDYLVDKNFSKAFTMAPFLMLSAVLNIFHHKKHNK